MLYLYKYTNLFTKLRNILQYIITPWTMERLLK